MRSNDYMKTFIVPIMIFVSTLIIGTIVVYANISVSKSDLFFSEIVINKSKNNSNHDFLSKYDFDSNVLSQHILPKKYIVSNVIMVWKETDDKFGWCSLNDKQIELMIKGVLTPDDMKVNAVYANNDFENIENIVRNNKEFKPVAKTISYR